MMDAKHIMASLMAASLLLPASALASTGTQPKRITVHPKARWHGYGFLPGYRQPPDNTDWRRRTVRRYDSDQRFINLYTGQVSYGFGYPGFYRGRYNGGSFGPCWTSTPIGFMPTCGQ
jgi:hypothetical protein